MNKNCIGEKSIVEDMNRMLDPSLDKQSQRGGGWTASKKGFLVDECIGLTNA